MALPPLNMVAGLDDGALAESDVPDIFEVEEDVVASAGVSVGDGAATGGGEGSGAGCGAGAMTAGGGTGGGGGGRSVLAGGAGSVVDVLDNVDDCACAATAADESHDATYASVPLSSSAHVES